MTARASDSHRIHPTKIALLVLLFCAACGGSNEPEAPAAPAPKGKINNREPEVTKPPRRTEEPARAPEALETKDEPAVATEPPTSANRGKTSGREDGGEKTKTEKAPTESAKAPAPGKQRFAHTGAIQEFVVPAGVKVIDVKAWGAGGGGSLKVGGGGGYVAAKITLPAGCAKLKVIVGGAGRGTPTYEFGASGGGRTSIACEAQELLTAGAGGGGGSEQPGGAGGAEDEALTAATGKAGGGGSQTAGGAGGVDNASANYNGSAGASQRGGDGYGGKKHAGGFPDGGHGGDGTIETYGGSGGGGGKFGGGGGAGFYSHGGGGGSSDVPAGATAEKAVGADPGAKADPEREGAGEGGASYKDGAHGALVIKW